MTTTHTEVIIVSVLQLYTNRGGKQFKWRFLFRWKVEKESSSNSAGKELNTHYYVSWLPKKSLHKLLELTDSNPTFLDKAH